MGSGFRRGGDSSRGGLVGQGLRHGVFKVSSESSGAGASGNCWCCLPLGGVARGFPSALCLNSGGNPLSVLVDTTAAARWRRILLAASLVSVGSFDRGGVIYADLDHSSKLPRS